MLGLAGLGSAGVLIGWNLAHVSREQGVTTVLRKRLDYLKLHEPGVRQFARDYVARAEISSAKLHAIAAFAPLYRRLPVSPDNSLSGLTRYGEERIVTYYLMSSDFFLTGADEQRMVHYVGYFDPLRACGNPFARPAT